MKFTDATAQFRVGNPRSETTDMGPVISDAHRKRVEDFVRSGCDEGARLVAGGSRPNDPEVDGGCYYLPTILEAPSMQPRVAREEIFGPVAVVIPFEDEADAVALANATRYGLAASIWTSDVTRALRVARKVRAGDVSINISKHAHLEAPFGGFAMSDLAASSGCLRSSTTRN